MPAAAELFTRHAGNPMLTPERWPYPINAVMNAGATKIGDETVLLCRVEDRRGFSHLTVARSRDGASNWHVDEQPFMSPDPAHPEEEWGLEDPRVTYVEELSTWIISYTAFGPGGPGVALAKTDDFRSVERLGLVIPPEDKNGVLLPERVDGKWIFFHRPPSEEGSDVYLSRSEDMLTWSDAEMVLRRRPGGWWDTARVGMGPPPLKTEHGWLFVYHGVRVTVAGALYRAGLGMLDLKDPTKVIHRSDEWVLGPAAQFEVTGDVPNVIFPCGLVHDHATDVLSLYYGAADTRVGLATARRSEVIEYLLGCPPG